MHTVTKVRSYTKTLMNFALLACLEFSFTKLSYAQGGLVRVNTTLDNILTVLRAGSITAATIACIWAGYEYWARHSDLKTIGRIVAGGVLIGGSSEIAHWMLS